MSKRPHPGADNFNIGWICALQIEVDAARAVLDEEYDDFHQSTSYITGRIGQHDVVIACPPAGQIGIGAAAITAERLKASFSSIQYFLMVGVGGGVPSSATDIRLGDVVISQPTGTFGGVVQYDMGKTGPGGCRSRTGFLNGPPQSLLAAVTKMRSNINCGRSTLDRSLEALAFEGHFVRPASSSDVLFEASYHHPGGPDCANCCKDMIVQRVARQDEGVTVHYGLIASGSQVIKDGLTRDELSSEFGGVLCFEMEAAGLMNSFPCIVVRGICDYADSHKNKRWQPFAAASAACCAKEILGCVLFTTQGQLTRPDSRSSLPAYPYPTLSGSPRAPVFLESNILKQSGFKGPVTLAKSTLSDDERQSYFEALKFDQLEFRHLSIKTAHSETCRWLLDRSVFNKWLDSNENRTNHGFLWIKGKAATGKSTMMKFLLSFLKNGPAADVIIAFFFHARGEDLEKSTLGMYQSLLYQVLEQCPDLKDSFDLCSTSLKRSGKVFWTIESLQTLLRHAVSRLGERSMICVIDALDECLDNEVQDMVDFFDSLGIMAVGSGLHVRVLFSSRHYPFIFFEKGLSLVLEDQAEHTKDISEYLRTELKAGESVKIQMLRTEILERSSGVFLWAVLVVDMLNTEYRRGRLHAMEKRLKEIPNDVQRLFHEILNRESICPEETILCLKWVLHARRPLKLEELYFAVISGFDPESVAVWNQEELTKEDMERFILDVSRGLLEETKTKARTIQFIHESVVDFLRSGKELNRDTGASADIFRAQSHDELKSCCLTYYQRANIPQHKVQSRLLRSKQPGIQDYRSEALGDFPFLQYAVQNVLFHCDVAESLGSLQKVFIDSFDAREWYQLSNTIQRPGIRWYGGYESVLFPFADQNLLHLTKLELRRPGALDSLSYRQRFLVLTCLATDNPRNLKALKTWLSAGAPNALGLEGLPPSVDMPDNIVMDLLECLRHERQSFSDQSKEPTLLWAVQHGRVEMVQLLLSCPGIDPYVQWKGNDVVTLATGQADLGLLKIFLELDISRYMSPARAFVIAIEQGLVDVARVLHQKFGSRVRSHDAHSADDIVKLLSELDKVDPDKIDDCRETPLFQAVDCDHDQLVNLLLTYPHLDVNRANRHRETPLHRAVDKGSTHIVQSLLHRSDLEVNRRNRNGDTPLLRAVDCGHEMMVKLLLTHPNVSLSMSDVGLESLLTRAVDKGSTNIVKILLSHRGSNVNFALLKVRTPLSRAISLNRLDLVSLLLRYPATEVNTADSEDLEPLLQAMRDNNTSVVRLLLDHPTIAVNKRCKNGYTPLLWGIQLKHIDLVQMLLDHHNIKVNQADEAGITPLLKAINKQTLDIAYLILKHRDVDVNLADQTGETPLVKAIRICRCDFVHLLLTHKSIDVVSSRFDTVPPLIEAIKSCSLETVRMILKRPEIECRVVSQQTLNLAVAEESIATDMEVLKLLCKHSNIDQPTLCSTGSSDWSFVEVSITLSVGLPVRLARLHQTYLVRASSAHARYWGFD